MRRYKRLTQEDIYEALNKLRDSFLAAKDGNQVNEIMDSIMTYEEKIKIGRRIVAADFLKDGHFTFEEIRNLLKIGKSTLQHVAARLVKHPMGFELINSRSIKVEKEYQAKKYKMSGGSTLIRRRKEYSGIKRKDIKR